MELRRFTRVPIHQLLLFATTGAGSGEDAFVEGAATDISLGGLFIATEFPAPFESEIVIHMRLEGTEGEFVLPGVVRWTRPEGMGVQFGLLGARETFAITEIGRRYELSLLREPR